MRLIAATLSVIAALAVAPLARAQETDEQIKKRILDKVRERLTEEKKTILERMSKVIDEELSGAPRKVPGGAGTTDKRIRDLERKLQQLDDQREDLQRDIRSIKRETEDAKIIREATNSPPETGQDAGRIKAAFDTHNEARWRSRRTRPRRADSRSRSWIQAPFYARRTTSRRAALTIPSAYTAACGYALVGNVTEAIDWLEISIKAGYNDWDHIREDSDLELIRKERRYLRIMTDR
jgi:hypothetical protein